MLSLLDLKFGFFQTTGPLIHDWKQELPQIELFKRAVYKKTNIRKNLPTYCIIVRWQQWQITRGSKRILNLILYRREDSIFHFTLDLLKFFDDVSWKLNKYVLVFAVFFNLNIIEIKFFFLNQKQELNSSKTEDKFPTISVICKIKVIVGHRQLTYVHTCKGAVRRSNINTIFLFFNAWSCQKFLISTRD